MKQATDKARAEKAGVAAAIAHGEAIRHGNRAVEYEQQAADLAMRILAAKAKVNRLKGGGQ